jgi:hypothetical protein
VAPSSHEVHSFTRRVFWRRQQLLVHGWANYAFTEPFQELNCHTLYTFFCFWNTMLLILEVHHFPCFSLQQVDKLRNFTLLHSSMHLLLKWQHFIADIFMCYMSVVKANTLPYGFGLFLKTFFFFFSPFLSALLCRCDVSGPKIFPGLKIVTDFWLLYFHGLTHYYLQMD